jgi:hypothetical protein
MVQGMPRRHLFDNGSPPARATLVAGSHVLLALSRQSLRKSRLRIGASRRRIADTSQRVIHTLARHGCSRMELSISRENYGHLVSHAHQALNARAAIETGTGLEPGLRRACEEPHQP